MCSIYVCLFYFGNVVFCVYISCKESLIWQPGRAVIRFMSRASLIFAYGISRVPSLTSEQNRLLWVCTLTSWLGLDDMSLAWLDVVQLLVSIYSNTCSRISPEYSSLFIIVINFTFMFSLCCTDSAGTLYANEFFFMYFCINSVGTQGEAD